MCYTAAMKNCDPVKILQAFVARQGTQTAAAEALGCSKQYICDVLQGRKEPGPAILYGLGIERIVTYRIA
jgi:transcriptional regulator with XRE-family HTH domain